jgi:hypothetical protein
MIAFSCCVYDGGDEEKEMDAAREIGWRRKFTKRGRVIRPGIIRMNGKCPLTPLEVCQDLKAEGRTTAVITISEICTQAHFEGSCCAHFYFYSV